MATFLFHPLESVPDTLVDRVVPLLSDERRQLVLNSKSLLRRRELVVTPLMLVVALRHPILSDLSQMNELAVSDLVSVVLSIENGLERMPRVKVGPHGKPFLEDYDGISFNVSHSRQSVALVVSPHSVGVDIEQLGRYKDGLLERAFSPEEQQIIKTSDDRQLAFSRLWTRKEAYLKMKGTGITGFDQLAQVPPADFSIATLTLPHLHSVMSIAVEES